MTRIYAVDHRGLGFIYIRQKGSLVEWRRRPPDTAEPEAYWRPLSPSAQRKVRRRYNLDSYYVALVAKGRTGEATTLDHFISANPPTKEFQHGPPR